MNFAKAVAGAAVLLAALTGCNVTDQNKPEIDDVGKQIVAEWKSSAGVEDAAYEYVHGLDLGQQIHLQATLTASSAKETKYEELVEVARKCFWKSGDRTISMPYAFYSTDNPPTGKVRSSPNSVSHGYVEIDFQDKAVTSELEQKYGPQSTRK